MRQINRNWASLAAMKQSPIWLNAAVNVGSDLQNDSSTDIVVDSSDTALDKKEMGVIIVPVVLRLNQNVWMLV